MSTSKVTRFKLPVTCACGSTLQAAATCDEQHLRFAQTCASYDRKHWFRVPTHYDSHHGVLLIKHKPERVCSGRRDESSHHLQGPCSMLGRRRICGLTKPKHNLPSHCDPCCPYCMHLPC